MAAVAGGLVAGDDRGPCFLADAVVDPLCGLVAAAAVLEALVTGGRWLLSVALAPLAAAVAVGCIHGAGAAPHDVLLIPGPVVHALDARIARDHPCRIVAGLVRQAFQGHIVSGGDFDNRQQAAAEVAPVDGAIRCRHMPMPGAARWIGQLAQRYFMRPQILH